MKAVLGGMLVAAIIAIGAAAVLDNRLQESSTDRFQTTGVRL